MSDSHRLQVLNLAGPLPTSHATPPACTPAQSRLESLDTEADTHDVVAQKGACIALMLRVISPAACAGHPCSSEIVQGERDDTAENGVPPITGPELSTVPDHPVRVTLPSTA